MRGHHYLRLVLAFTAISGSVSEGRAQAGRKNVAPAADWVKAAEITKLQGHRGSIHVAFLPDSKQMLSADKDHVRLWNLGTGKETKKIKVTQDNQGIACLALSGDGKKAAVGGYQFLTLLDVSNMEVRHRQDLKKGTHALDVRCVAFAPKDDRLLAGGLIDDRVLYDEKGEYLKGIDKGIKNVILVRDVATWKDHKRLPIGPDHCYRVAYLPGGRQALVAFDEFAMTLVDVEKGNKLHKYPAIRQFRAGGLAVSNDGSKFLFAQQGILAKGDKEGVLLFDVTSGKKLHELHLPEFGVGGNVNNFDEVAFSPDGKHACFVGRHKVDLTSKQYAVALVYDVATWKEVARFHFPKTASFGGVAFSPDAQLLAVGAGDGVVTVFRAGTREQSSEGDALARRACLTGGQQPGCHRVRGCVSCARCHPNGREHRHGKRGQRAEL